jgi:hypothetical protein
VFDSVVAGAFQITFRAKMHANNIFLFFKNYFWHQYIKIIQNIQIILNFSKRKIKFFGNAAAAAFPNVPIQVEQDGREMNQINKMGAKWTKSKRRLFRHTSRRSPLATWKLRRAKFRPFLSSYFLKGFSSEACELGFGQEMNF